MFAGLCAAVAGNVLVARRYGARVMAWTVPKEARYNQYEKRTLYQEYWHPEMK